MPTMRFIFVFLLLILVASIVNNYFQLYDRWYGVSVIMHLAGGAWVALAASHYKIRYPVAAVVVVAVGWELFEFTVDQATGAHVMMLWDSGVDILMGMIGAVIILWLARSK